MAKRTNEFLETRKALKENEEARIKRIQEAHNKELQSRKDFEKNYYTMRENREMELRRHSKLIEEAKNSALSTVLKGIYITALEAHTLTDDGIILAESMVDNYIKERGGATKILNACKENTYVLSTLARIVEDAAEDEVKEIEKDPDKEDEEDKKKSESKKNEEKEDKKDNKKSEDSSEPIDMSTDFIDDDDTEKKSDSEKEDKKDNKKSEDSSEPIDMSTDFIDDDDEESAVDKDGNPENDDTEAAEEIIDDIEDDNEDEESAGPIFDELKKEDDIKKAIKIIQKRVADAEEAFIQRNKEDKEQINQLLSKISGNVKTVEDIADDNDPKSKVAQESARMVKQQIDKIRNSKPMRVFDKMARKVTSSIVKDKEVREHYVLESGQLDMPMIMETTKVMYAFLETVNTLQLEKVDEKYIQELLEKM